MNFFPDVGADRPAGRNWFILIVPLLFLATTIAYSVGHAPWGQNVDPESSYAMNGLVGALGYPFMKNDHPGTTTILMVAVLARV